jgi:zinc transporter ZupT
MKGIVWFIFLGVPLATLGFVVSLVLRRYKAERRRISAWFAITFTALSALGGVWGFVILDQLRTRNWSDYGYESRCFGLAFIGGLATFVWIIRSRKLPAFLTLGASIWIGIVWMSDLATL